MAHIDSLFVQSILVLGLLHIGGTLLAGVRRREKRVTATAPGHQRHPVDVS